MRRNLGRNAVLSGPAVEDIIMEWSLHSIEKHSIIVNDEQLRS